MEGYFKNANSIAQLINNLTRETLEITLWQNGRRLAYYQGVIMDLLQNTEPKLQCPHVNTRQLLMKTTPAFPVNKLITALNLKLIISLQF